MNKPPDIQTMSFSVDLAREPDFDIGTLRVRPSLRRVLCGGHEEAVQPRVMQVLVALAGAEGAVVSREELIERCWDGVVVGDDSITHSIAKVRQLADCGGQRAFEIETIPRVGYRLTRNTDFGPAAEAVGPYVQPTASPGRAWQLRRIRLAAAGTGLALMLVAVALVSWRSYSVATIPPAASRPAAHSVPAPLTLAVLPFANLSGNPNQDFFSDGMTEEVNGALSNVSGLRVIARRSAFQFKNQNRDVRTVARLLGAGHLIEGSVRRQGSRVRISVQLVRGADGVELWSQKYDRNVTDIFAVEEEIASSIAAALRVPLGLVPGEQLVANRTRDLDSYEQYLRARALYRGRHVQEAISVLEPAVARDPSYAPGHSLLAMSYGLIPVYLLNESEFPSLSAGRALINRIYVKAEAEARTALRLDPHQSEAYVALALIDADRLNWIAAEDNFRRALSINPNDADAIHLYGLTLTDIGLLRDALASRKKLHALEPFVPIYSTMTAAMLQMTGEGKAAMTLLSTTPAGGPTSYWRSIYLARGYAASGRFAEAAETLQTMSGEVKRVSRRSVEDGAALLRLLGHSQPLPEPLPALEGELGFVYAFTAQPQRVLAGVERDLALNFGDLAPFDSPWLPLYSPVRKTERFRKLVGNAGLVTYWRQRKWADHCHPTRGDEFACD